MSSEGRPKTLRLIKMDPSSKSGTIVATAIAAATAGAAITYTALKCTRKEEKVGGLRKGRASKSALIYDNVNLDKNTDQREILFPHNHEEKMKRRIAARVSVEEENMTPRQSVTVRVPATSANVGPGCECVSFHQCNVMLVFINSHFFR